MICVYFNPRSHERSDETYKTLYISDLISIHAPTRGATLLKLAISISLIFQSTLPREERPMLLYRSAVMLLFQSTLPREERPSLYNSLCLITISIHAPTRGATVIWLLIRLKFIFQSTLPREERRAVAVALQA